MTGGARRYVVLTDGFLTDRHAKTAHGVMQYGRDTIVAVVDARFAGANVRDVMPRLGCSAPIVANVASALTLEPTSLLVGVATQGGYMPPNFRVHVLAAIDAGLEVVCGLHQLLADDPEFVARAKRSGARLWDVRIPPDPIPLYSGAAARVPQDVLLAVGTDCAIGKMSAMLEVERAGRAAGARAEFVATGQTGIMIAGKGICVDRVISDFVTGAAERLVLDASPDSEVLLVEGQGSIIHPAYAPVTYGLLFGCAPDALVMCHESNRETIEEYGVPIPDLGRFARMHEAALAPIKPAKTVAVSLNTSALDDAGARTAIARAEESVGVPADDPVRFGGGKLWRAIAAALAALLLAPDGLGLAGCTSSSHSWTIHGLVRLSETEEPNALVRMFSNQASADDMTALLFEPLFRLDNHGDPVPSLATRFPTTSNGLISEDGLRITFPLRHGVTWSDGAPVTADDVIFTWHAIMNPDNAVVSTWGYDDIQAMRKDNAHQVTMILRRPLAAAVFLFSEGSFPPLPEHVLSKFASLNKVAYLTTPVGDGPFVVSRWTHGQDLVLGANPRYWRGPPRVREVDVKFIPDANTVAGALRNHEIDVVDGVSKPLVPQLQGVPGIRLEYQLLANYRHMEFNCRDPILADANVRRAIAHAVDVDRIIRDAYGGYGIRAVTDIPPTSWAYRALPPPAFDSRLATRLLDQAGWTMGPDGVRRKGRRRLSLTITSSTGNRPNARAEEMVAQQLKAVGIELAIKNYAPSVLFARDGPLYSGRYQLEWTVSTEGTDPDNIGNWGCAYMPPRGANTAFYCNPRVDEYLRDAQTHYDHARRTRDYELAWRIMLRDTPGVMIYWDREVVATNADLRNFKPAPAISDYWNAYEWRI